MLKKELILFLSLFSACQATFDEPDLWIYRSEQQSIKQGVVQSTMQKKPVNKQELERKIRIHRNLSKIFKRRNPGVLDPFEVGWFSNNLGLDKSHIEESSFGFDGLQFILKFDSVEHGKAFYERLRLLGVPADFYDFNKTIEIPLVYKYKLLHAVRQSDKSLAPFSLPFFVKYFEVDKNTVQKTEEVDLIIERWTEVIFTSRASVESFLSQLRKAGICSFVSWEKNGVKIYHTRENHILLFSKALSHYKY